MFSEPVFLKIKVPPQLSLGLAADLGKAASEVVGTGAKTVLYGQVITNILLGSSMDVIFGIIAFMQLVVFNTLIKINFPGSATLIYGVLLKVATFDMLPTEDWFPHWFSLPETDPLNE